MSLSFDDMLAHHAEVVFTNTNHFSRVAAHYHYSSGSFATASVNGDFEESGTVEVEDDQGRRFVRAAKFRMLRSATVSLNKGELTDYFVIDGDRWSVYGFGECDSAMQTVLLRHDDKISTKRGMNK